MILSSHQSSFFPWIGYWAKIEQSDEHVVSRNVEFNPRNYQNRVEVYGSLRTLPVLKPDVNRPYICEVKYDRANAKKLIEGLKKELLGKKCKNPEAVEALLMAAYAWNTGRLLDLNMGVLEAGRRLFDIRTMIGRDLQDGAFLTKTGRLIARLDLRAYVGPVTYLAGSGQRAYLDEKELPDNVSVVYQVLPKGLPSCSILELLHRMEMSEIVQIIAQIKETTGADRVTIPPLR